MRSSFAKMCIVMACWLAISGPSAAQTLQLTDTSAAAWNSPDDATVTKYVAVAYPKQNVINGVPSGPPALTFDFGKPVANVAGDLIGPPIKPLVRPGVEYILFLTAQNASGTSPLSNPTEPFVAGTVGQTSNTCDHPLTISVQDWTQTVAVGTRGRILVQLQNSFPIIQLQVKLAGQVIGEVNGTELRDLAGLYFSVPRTPGAYALTVFAKDNTGCSAETTLSRSVTVF